jgi:hypothetical protein
MKKTTFYIRSLCLSLCLSCLTTFAGGLSDAEGYYWYHVRVSAYPTGKGLVYASHGLDEDEEAIKSKLSDEVILKFVEEKNFNASINVYNKPNEGYQFNGWYYNLPEFDFSQNYISNNSYIGGDFLGENLGYVNTSDNEEEHYSEEPDTDILGVFGKVSCGFSIDNVEFFQNEDNDDIHVYIDGKEINDANANDALKSFIARCLFGNISKDISVMLDNPGNDVGDKLTITTAPYFDYLPLDNEESEVDTTEVARLKFVGWTDTHGNKYDDVELAVDVIEVETYTAHYRIETLNTGIHQLGIKKEDNMPTYDLYGRKVRLMDGKHGLYISKGRKYIK